MALYIAWRDVTNLNCIFFLDIAAFCCTVLMCTSTCNISTENVEVFKSWCRTILSFLCPSLIPTCYEPAALNTEVSASEASAVQRD